MGMRIKTDEEEAFIAKAESENPGPTIPMKVVVPLLVLLLAAAYFLAPHLNSKGRDELHQYKSNFLVENASAYLEEKTNIGVAIKNLATANRLHRSHESKSLLREALMFETPSSRSIMPSEIEAAFIIDSDWALVQCGDTVYRYNHELDVRENAGTSENLLERIKNSNFAVAYAESLMTVYSLSPFRVIGSIHGPVPRFDVGWKHRNFQASGNYIGINYGDSISVFSASAGGNRLKFDSPSFTASWFRIFDSGRLITTYDIPPSDPRIDSDIHELMSIYDLPTGHPTRPAWLTAFNSSPQYGTSVSGPYFFWVGQDSTHLINMTTDLVITQAHSFDFTYRPVIGPAGAGELFLSMPWSRGIT